MELSVFLARFFAAVYIATGIAAIADKDLFKKIKDDLFKNTAMMYIGGAFALVFGLFLVSYHNVWENNWRTVITIFGWLALVKGILFIAFPKTAVRFYTTMINAVNSRTIGIVLLALGLFFAYGGFMV